MNHHEQANMTGLSEYAQDFIKQCFLPMSKRPNIFQLLNHPWLLNKAPVIPLMNTQTELEHY